MTIAMANFKNSSMDSLFFEQLANYYWHENDLSNITVALCNSSEIFKKIFVHFFFPKIKIEDISNINREIWDSNSMSSRVDIHISLYNDEIYVIEVKKGDRNHHFGQYEIDFDIDKSHFGYITNYYCAEGKALGYDVKTWTEFYDVLEQSENLDCLSKSYLSYLRIVCGITKYNSIMDLKSLKSIPQFFQTMDKIVAKEAQNLHISPLDEKRGAWNYSYKGFGINRKVNNEHLTNGYFLLCYNGQHIISIGIASCAGLSVKDIEKEAKNEHFSYSNVPYIATDWWGYLWYDLSDSAMDDLQNAKSIAEQENVLANFLKEVIESIRRFEKN